MTKKHMRRKYFISKRSQGKFILRFVIASITGGIVAVTIFNLLAHRKIEAVLYAMRLPRTSPGDILLAEMLYATAFAALFIIIAFIVSARGLLIKISGPLKKLANDLRRISRGDLSSPVRLRQKDEFKDFAGDLENMRAALNNRFTRIIDHADQLIDLSESGRKNPAGVALPDIKRQVAGLAEEIRVFKL